MPCGVVSRDAAPLASRLKAFRLVFGATLSIEDLQAHDAHLVDLYDWYRHTAEMAGIRTATYIERRPLHGMMIVERAFAHPGVGANPVLVEEDHLSIAKPRSRDALVYGAAHDLLRDHVLAAPERAPGLGRPMPARRLDERPPQDQPPRTESAEALTDN